MCGLGSHGARGEGFFAASGLGSHASSGLGFHAASGLGHTTWLDGDQGGLYDDRVSLRWVPIVPY